MKMQKTWFIAGGSGGFGLAITNAALAKGDRVVATFHSHGQDLLNEFNQNPNLLVVKMDVAVEPQVKDAVQQAIDRFDKVDILVNSAGYGLLAGVEEASDAEVKQNYEVNVFGTLHVVRAMLPFMRKERSGHIINISAAGGLSAYAGWGLFCSTQFALEGITEALALELNPLGIYATVVAPGFFRTNFLDKSSLVSSKLIMEDYAGTVGVMREFVANVNKKEAGDPQKLAEAIIKLAASKNPPVHLPLGNDALDRYRAKTSAFERNIQEWYDTITTTDYADEVAATQSSGPIIKS